MRPGGIRRVATAPERAAATSRTWAAPTVALALALGLSSAIARDASAQDASDPESEAPPPTFEEVMDNPGDLRLSFRYAREQVRQGNLTRASTTLDRILLLQPNLHDVRLMYGIVLFRLGDLAGARAELDRVDADALPANLQAELERYRKRVAEASRTTTGSALVGTGFAHETNPAASPNGGDVVVFDIPLEVQEEDDDFSWLFDARGEIRHELQTQLPVTLFAQGTLSVREHFEVDSQDTVYGAVRGGADVRTLWLDLEPSVSFGKLRLSNADFYSFAGAGLRAEKPLDGRVTAFLDGAAYAESFEGISENPNNDQRTGNRYTLSAGLRGVVTPNIRLDAALDYTRKTARVDFQQYDQAQARVTVTAVLFDGHYLQAGATRGLRTYDANDPFISAMARDDDYTRLRLSYGLPLRLTDDFPEALEGVRLVPSVEYYSQDSNIPNYEYDNFTTSVMISKDFQF